MIISYIHNLKTAQKTIPLIWQLFESIIFFIYKFLVYFQKILLIFKLLIFVFLFDILSSIKNVKFKKKVIYISDGKWYVNTYSFGSGLTPLASDI